MRRALSKRKIQEKTKVLTPPGRDGAFPDPPGSPDGIRRSKHRPVTRILSVGTVATIAGVGLAACGGGSSSSSAATTSSKKPIVICEVAANSGPFVELGKYDEIGASAWAHQINANGGILGRSVKLVKENDASKPATAASLVRRCVSQVHANFIFGPEETTTSAAAIPIANELKTVDLGWQSGWKANGYKASELTGYFFPSVGNVFFADDQAMAKFVVAPQHYSRVAVIEDNTAGGLPNGPYVKSLGKKYGFKVVSTQVLTAGSTNDTPQALKLLAAKPQAVFLGLTPGPDSITAIKAIRAQDPTIPIGVCSRCTSPSFIHAVGVHDMQHVYLIGTPQFLVSSTPSTSANQAAISDTSAYLSAMKAAGYTSTTDINDSSVGWDSGRELAAAIRSAGSTSESAVRSALAHQSITVGGILAYHFKRTPNNYGNITKLVAAVSVVKSNGSVAVYKAG